MGGGANANVGRAMVNNLHIQQMAIHQKRQQAALRQQQQQLENEMNGPGNQSNQGVMAQMQRNQTAAKMAAAAAAAAKGASGNNTRVAEVSLEKRMQNMQNIVENAVKQTLRWKNYVENDAKRSKAERIQNTLAELRNMPGAEEKTTMRFEWTTRIAGSSTSTLSAVHNDNNKEDNSGNDSGRI